ncbi:MAG: hypothetical protein ABIT20_26460 [Gemmatimonadaceae bacterium]
MSHSTAQKLAQLIDDMVGEPMEAPSVGARYGITPSGEEALAEEEQRILDLHAAQTRLEVQRSLRDELEVQRARLDADVGGECCPTCTQKMDDDVRARLRVVMTEHLDAAQIDERYFIQRILQLGGVLPALPGELGEADDELPF